MRFMSTRHRTALSALVLLTALASSYNLPAAQTPSRKVLGVEDYTKWRTIADSSISGDGKWVTYTLQQTNTTPAEAKPVLHLLNLETNETVTVAHASGGTLSADSK